MSGSSQTALPRSEPQRIGCRPQASTEDNSDPKKAKTLDTKLTAPRLRKRSLERILSGCSADFSSPTPPSPSQIPSSPGGTALTASSLLFAAHHHNLTTAAHAGGHAAAAVGADKGVGDEMVSSAEVAEIESISGGFVKSSSIQARPPHLFFPLKQ